MRRKELVKIALVLLIVLPLIFVGLVNSQTLPIGDPGYKQANPFDSNPTDGVYTNIGTPSGVIGNAYDGDLDNNINWVYGAMSAAGGYGYVETSAFKRPSDNGLTDFAITYVDIKVSYKAGGIATSDDRYRIVAYVDPSATEVLLQDWLTGVAAKYDPGLGAQGHRVFSKVAEPNDGVWTWTDLAGLRVRFDCNRVGTNNLQRVYLYEVWVTAYSTPYPATGTMSVQPSAVVGLHAGDLFFIDIYVAGVTKLWAYTAIVYFDSTILAPDITNAYFSYGPFVSALPSEVGPDYISVTYKTYDGDPNGFTGSTPVCRMYFQVVKDGTTVLELRRAQAADIGGGVIPVTANNGVFASNPVRDVALTTVTVDPINVAPGESVQVKATVENHGTYIETFNVIAYNDSSTIETKTVTDLLPGASEVLSFVWDTSGALGFYQIKVEAPVTGDEKPSDNVKVWTDPLVPEGVLVGKHDIAVTSILRAFSNGTAVPANQPCNVTRRDTVYINFTVVNLGHFSETFNITAVWQGIYNIGNLTDVSLDVGASKDLSFKWNTDVTYPTWEFGQDRWGNPKNVSKGDVEVVAAPDWKSDGTVYSKGVPYEKRQGFYDYTANNVKETVGEVWVNRDVRYPTAKFGVTKSDLFVSEPATFMGGPPGHSQTPPGTTIDVYRWDFGDDNITEGNYPTIMHAYTSPGKYSVNLTVTNSIGLSKSIVLGQQGAGVEGKKYIEVNWRNVKIVSVDASPTSVLVGQNVTVNVTIKNDGVKDESFAATKKNVTVYYNDVMIASVLAPDLGSYDAADNSSTVAFNWTTSGLSPGAYTVKAVLDVLQYENNTDDNIGFFAGQVTLLWHNIAVTSVTTSKNEAVISESVPISVTVVNQGDFNETFTVTVYYNDTALEDAQTVTDLLPNDSKILDFSWNTTNLTSGVYTIKAVASNVTDEAQVDDNVYPDGSVTLVEPVVEPSNLFLYVVAGVVIAIVAGALVGVYFLKVRKPKVK